MCHFKCDLFGDQFQDGVDGILQSRELFNSTLSGGYLRQRSYYGRIDGNDNSNVLKVNVTNWSHLSLAT